MLWIASNYWNFRVWSEQVNFQMVRSEGVLCINNNNSYIFNDVYDVLQALYDNYRSGKDEYVILIHL